MNFKVSFLAEAGREMVQGTQAHKVSVVHQVSGPGDAGSRDLSRPPRKWDGPGDAGSQDLSRPPGKWTNIKY